MWCIGFNVVYAESVPCHFWASGCCKQDPATRHIAWSNLKPTFARKLEPSFCKGVPVSCSSSSSCRVLVRVLVVAAGGGEGGGVEAVAMGVAVAVAVAIAVVVAVVRVGVGSPLWLAFDSQYIYIYMHAYVRICAIYVAGLVAFLHRTYLE